MPETATQQEVCSKCDAPVRENTVFCYNCGGRVADDPIETGENGDAPIDVETQAALDDLALRLSADEASGDEKLAKAAAERRRARVAPRKTKEYVWEPVEDGSGRLVFLTALLISVLAAAAVFFTVFIK